MYTWQKRQGWWSVVWDGKKWWFCDMLICSFVHLFFYVNIYSLLSSLHWCLKYQKKILPKKYTAIHWTTLNSTTTLYYTALLCTTLHYTALHCTTLHYTALNYRVSRHLPKPPCYQEAPMQGFLHSVETSKRLNIIKKKSFLSNVAKRINPKVNHF